MPSVKDSMFTQSGQLRGGAMDTAEYLKIMQILKKNKDKPFVNRILNPNINPRLDMGQNSHATHLMSWADAGDKYRVFPRVQKVGQDGMQLKEYTSWQNAYKRATERKNYIDFDTSQEADAFTKTYKSAWGD